MAAPQLSTTEYAVLGVLAGGPSHGFAIAKQLDAQSDVGRVFTVRRPLVYRALDRLVESGYAVPVSTERSDSGPQRVIHRLTPGGRRRLANWLAEPVAHIRDLRVEFLLKVTLLRRQGRSPLALIERQRRALAPRFDALENTDPEDHVELWRRHNAAAAAAYLDELERLHRRG